MLVLLSVGDRDLPAHCTPTNDFLLHFSRTFHTCVPTPLAFVSTTLGCLSIASWLFAQMPQIYKNWKLHSTSGLSIYFLAEWLLGDASNLLGCIFTGQASWQIVLAFYYCFVDIALVAQWMWYEHLRHGRPWRWSGEGDAGMSDSRGRADGMEEIRRQNSQPLSRTPSKPIQPQYMGMFRIPRFSFSRTSLNRSGDDRDLSTSPPSDSSNNRTITRHGPSASSQSLGISPRTVVYVSMLITILSHTANASPLSISTPHIQTTVVTETPTQIAGRILSWLSTLAYLLSRMPQLYKNYYRKSTSGLSPHLFVAAFFGNLFYSSSILTNPCAWSNFGPHGGHGWVDKEGSKQAIWVSKALPFWLGAAGVLVMDGAIGVQFLVYGDGGASQKPAVVVEEFVEPPPQDRDEDPMTRSTQSIVIKRPWRRVNGWMRGWVPSVSVAGTPTLVTARDWESSGSSDEEDEDDEDRSRTGNIGDDVARWEERQRLLSSRDASEEGEETRSYGAV